MRVIVEKLGVLRHRAAVAVTTSLILKLFEPSSRLELIVSTLVQLVPCLEGEEAKKLTNVDKVKLAAKGPWFRDVVDFKDAVGRHPVVW